MNMDPQRLIPGDATLIENIVNYLKAKGIFDEFRHECLADVDTKSSCQNLSQRVDGYTSKFLANETWHPDLNKNELRNKLRRHIDESGMLAVGADHVVEQVINPKIHQLFLPKIIEVVHQYVKEQSELLNKKSETTTSSENIFFLEKPLSDIPENKDKTSISDPIADILSFSYSKSKPTPATSVHVKTENVQHKHADLSKLEKKKEEKIIALPEKSTSETPCENPTTTVVTEAKPQIDKEKEKIKKEEQEIPQEVPKKAVKEEVKPEKKKTEDVKAPINETTTPVEENKPNVSASIKPTILSKRDFDKNKQKSKSVNAQKSSNSSSEIKKSIKKESSDKSSEKHIKSKPMKSSKESPSPTKNVSSSKSMFKEDKGEISKSKSYDSSSSKTSESSLKKSKSSSSSRKDSSNSKHKGYSEKSDKSKISKSSDKSELNIHHDSSNSEKGTKSIHYSSSYDSSQGSDQEKSSSSSSKKERQKHFSKHAKKEKSEHPDNTSKTLFDKKRTRDGDESPSKKHKSEKDSKHKFKDTTMIEAAKISSRSNSFGSTSSVSSSSNASKDNLVSNSDEISESSMKDKKKKQVKEKDSCQNPTKTLPPPPPPPPPSSSLSCELTSSAEMSSVEDTQSSSNSETSSSEEISEESSSDSELESKDLILNTLSESMLNSSTDNINAFYDIFLYSSSSSEFEGYGNSPEKKKVFQNVLKNIHESDISISSVHTSDLSSYDDELSSDDDMSFLTGGVKKRLTLKEAQDLVQSRAILQDKNKNFHTEDKSDTNEISLNKRCMQRSSSFLSSDDESSPTEPKRSLRRERKLNPRYASSEYTSIFNSRKETFITKQSSPSVKNHSLNSSPNTEPKYRKIDSLMENDKFPKKNSLETKIDTMHQDEIKKSQKHKRDLNTESQDEQDELSDSSEMSSTDEIDSIMDKKKLFLENDVPDADKLKLHMKLKPQNNSKLNANSYSLKRKLEVTESTPVKRPCSRSSVDSSSSEFVPNENKPFNNEKQNFEEKVLKDSNLKSSDLTGGIKKDLFCKQRTNNNGDILGQKDIFSKNSHGKTINNPEKKISESDTSKELNSL